MARAKGSWTKIAAVTVMACCCLGAVYGFGVWLDKQFYMRFDSHIFGFPAGDYGVDKRVYDPSKGTRSGAPQE